MTPSSLRRLVLAGVVALLVGGAACAETPEPETPEPETPEPETPDAQTPEPAQDDSIEAVRTRANAEDAEAQYNLGFMYATGQGVPEDDVDLGGKIVHCRVGSLETVQATPLAGKGFNAWAYASRGRTTSGDLFFVEFTNVETS